MTDYMKLINNVKIVTIRETLLRALDRASNAEDLLRAEAAFRNCTTEQMKEVWTGNGETRQQVLNGYRSSVAATLAAKMWVEQNCHE